MRQFVYEDYIADGFADDCEELIHQCLNMGTVTFQGFAEVWRNMNFSSIYDERTSVSEIAELSEEVIAVAKQRMMVDTCNFEESVVGLFIVYGLLNLQPYPGFAVLKIVPDDVPAISRIEFVARRDRRLDVLYILGHVLIKGPVQYHAESRPYGMEQSIRKYLEAGTSLEQMGVRPKGVFYRQNEELDVIKELDKATRVYELAKANCADETGRKDHNLSFIDKNFAPTLETALRKLINGLVDDTEQVATEDRSSLVQSIKRKAMENTVDPIKHLTGVHERKPKTSTSARTPDIKCLSGKVKSGSPKKQLISGSPQKQTRIVKKTRKRKISSSDSESLSDFHSDPENDNVSTNDEDYGEYLNDANTVETIDLDKDEPVKEYDIQIDTMPIVIKSNSTQNFEIEIIDQYKMKSGLKKPVDVRVVDSSDITLTEVPITHEPLSSTNRSFKSISKHKSSAISNLKNPLPCSSKTALPSMDADLTSITVENSLSSNTKPSPSKPSTFDPKAASESEISLSANTKLSPSKLTTSDPKDPSKSDGSNIIFKKPQLVSVVLPNKPNKSELKKTILKSKFKKLGLGSVANFKESPTKGKR